MKILVLLFLSKLTLFLRLLLLVFFFHNQVHASGETESPTTLKVIQDKKLVQTLTYSYLDQHPQKQYLKIPQDPAYDNQPREYDAIPFQALFPQIKKNPNTFFQIKATDGFTSLLSADKLLHQDQTKSIAYLAFEPPQKWPLLSKSHKTAGPFYLIWSHPELSHIQKEEWPYSIVTIEIKTNSLENLFPQIFPKPISKANSASQKGLHVFVKNCFTCHTLNQAGESSMGPDLNLPMNPTEYFKPKILKQFIRAPESVRTWPNRKMVGFNKDQLSERELDQLISYLQIMALQKKLPDLKK
ncbi:MAG: c-type cytochrome [Bdellovibrionales bacterium]|nr:c-type cytochrome [Bdellovibrionales bacterium]